MMNSGYVMIRNCEGAKLRGLVPITSSSGLYFDSRITINDSRCEAPLLILCPNHHRVIYKCNTAFDIVNNWDQFDTRQVVFKPKGMTAGQLLAGYQRSYKDFYSRKAG